MRVGLIQVDGKMPNLALMKLSAWHKKRGDEVVLVDMSHEQFDRIYASKIFVGGSGVDLKSELPEDIELEFPDYDLFKMSKGERIGFTSRGCFRSCEFCIVIPKEGKLRDTPFEWVNGADKVILLDNTFLASSKWREKLEYFIRHKTKVCFTQGLDIRLVNAENAKLLAKTMYYDRKFLRRRLYFAFDDPKIVSEVGKGIEMLNNVGIPPHHCMFYVLVGFNTTLEEDLTRIQFLKERSCLPYIMLYNDKEDKVLRRLRRWVNRRYYMVIPWGEFN